MTRRRTDRRWGGGDRRLAVGTWDEKRVGGWLSGRDCPLKEDKGKDEKGG